MAAAFAWLAALVGRSWGWGAVAVLCAISVAAVASLRRPAAAVLAAVACAAVLSGSLSAAREAATQAASVPTGPQRLAVRLAGDPQPSLRGYRIAVRPTHLWDGSGWAAWGGPLLAAYADEDPGLAAGDRAVITGAVTARPGRLRGDPVAGRVTVGEITGAGPARDPLFRAGNAVRDRVVGELSRFGGDPAAALVAGFLIGDVRDLPEADQAALRRSGLAHFVAVSGSNVALFLAALWLSLGPLGAGPRRRAAFGLAGLAVFVVATRWEPSVIRAATMASLVLVGRVAGVPVDAWAALGGTVTLLLVLSGELAVDIGFQLSVAATAGVLAGARFGGRRRPRWLWGTLIATAGAQLAVAPLLLAHFGSIPLLAPLTNLVAAPLVALATSLAGAGVALGWGPLMSLGVTVAGLVLGVARLAAGWPQLGVPGVAVVALAGIGALRERLRPGMALAGAVWLAWLLVAAGGLTGPVVVFLDVGQGDAAIVVGATGEVILIDGGPEPAPVGDALRRYGVRRVDLMVASHRHADHVTGLVTVVESLPVGRLWHAGRAEEGGPLVDLLAAAEARGVPAEVPAVGQRIDVGSVGVEVLGPRRRYASPNDESLVLRVTAGERTVLFPGDIEVVAQRELGPLANDVLKVPHQGAATSDAGWLAASAGAVAVISVGPNTFGHPAPWVIDLLEEAGAEVHRTDREGDVIVPLR